MPPFFATGLEGHLALSQLIMKNKTNVNVTFGPDESTPLHWVVDYALAQLLIENGAQLNAQDKVKLTPLHLACERGAIKIAQLLIEKGADISARDIVGYTPLHIACEEGHVEIAKLLIKNGADINIPDDKGRSPFYRMCENIELAKWLITHILLNDITEKKPDFINRQHDLSVHWDNQIKKINYLPHEEIIGSKYLTKTIVSKVSSEKNNTLLSYSLHQIFKSLDSTLIKDKFSNETDHALSNTNAYPKLR